MLAPPPDPPRPGLSPPEGDMASEPLPPPGIPTLEPGWDEITIPEPSLLPASLLGGARTEPVSPGPPRPEPFLPEPESPEPEPIEGGGGTTLFASSGARPEAPEFSLPVGEPWFVPEPPTDGAGGMTLDAPSPGALPEVELPEPAIDGGGGTIFAVSDSPGAPAALRAVAEPTVGGGGTTLAARAPPVHRYEKFLMRLPRRRWAEAGQHPACRKACR